MEREKFEQFIAANGHTWDEYEAYARGYHDGTDKAGEFKPENDIYQTSYIRYILNITT